MEEKHIHKVDITLFKGKSDTSRFYMINTYQIKVHIIIIFKFTVLTINCKLQYLNLKV